MENVYMRILVVTDLYQIVVVLFSFYCSVSVVKLQTDKQRHKARQPCYSSISLKMKGKSTLHQI